nr:HlyD family efflux transporter periplasmic adaptor subunit [uncultured Glaciecola sp.]
MRYSTELFRKEAIEGQNTNNFGEAMLLPKTNHQILAVTLICWFLFLCGLLLSASFSSKATVNGWLVRSKPSIDIMAKETNGIIKSIQISNGNQVFKGQVLLEVSRNASALINENYQQQLDSLLQQRKLLEKRELILINKYQQQERQNEGAIQNYQQHLKLNFGITKRLEKRAQQASNEEAVLLSLLHNHSISKSTYNTQKEKRQAIEFQLAQTYSTKLDFEQRLLSAKQNQVSSKITSDEEQNALESQLQRTTQEIKRFQGAGDYLIKSPIDGIVNNLQATNGETISGNIPLMQITPLNNPLKAVLYVPSNNAGFIKSEQLVQLKLNAFPYQKFGTSKAHVSHVSQQVLLPHQVKRSPMRLNGPVFLIEATLDTQTVNARGDTVKLKAGMLFKAEITLSNRSLLEWLLSPIYSLRGQIT